MIVLTAGDGKRNYGVDFVMLRAKISLINFTEVTYGG